MPRSDLLKNVKRIVVKIGTSTITDEGEISDEKLSSVVDGVSSLMERGYEVVLVTSGAITAGATELKKKSGALSIPEKQALASVGQTILINEYRKYFARRGLSVGQILLTEDDVKHRRRFLNARHTINTLLQLGVVPIVNENDTVVVKEIKFGDNDTLSAHIASVVDAQLLILLSDIDGFYNDLSDDMPVEEIYRITPDVIEKAGGAGSAYGTGGMITKIRAAEIIIRFGEKMIIANGNEDRILARIMDGENIGTIFAGNGKTLSSRKKWLAVRKPKGSLSLDDGAVAALVSGKKSLLASGILDIEGSFNMGDCVEFTGPGNLNIGKGIVNYDNNELHIIKGKKSSEIKKILGSRFFDEVVNRDNIVIY